MLKKYIPYFIILLALTVLYFVKTHQRGDTAIKERVQVTTDAVAGEEGFSRHPEKIIYTKHARCRMECRHITEEEVKEILETGKLKTEKIEESDKGFTYPIDGNTKDDKQVRIVVAPKKNDVVIVTVIDLDKDWPCGSCK